jgi:DNA polymerase-3 subunit beta
MRLAVTGTVLAMSTFDYETSALASVPVSAGEDGTVLVSGRLLAEIVKALPARPAEMATDGTRVTLRCGSSVFTLHEFPAGEYPALPGMPPAAGTVGADLLAAAIGQVAVAAGRDDTLPALTGIRCEFDGDTVTLVATDRYRLAVRQFPWKPAVAGLEAQVLVPARSLTEAARSFGSAAEVAIGLTPDGVQGATGIIGWAAGGRETTTRLLGGEYPRYQSLLPPAEEFTATAELAVGPFAEAVKRVALVAERNTPVRLTFTADGLLLEAGAGDEATALETLETSFGGAGDLRVNFNPQYLLDGLTAVSSDTAVISFTTPTRPAVLTGKDGGDGYRYVLMPIRAAG